MIDNIKNLNVTHDVVNGTSTVSGNCVFTDTPYSVTVPDWRLLLYENGALAQDAFPTLNADDREFLISGISPAGWAQIHGDNK